MKNIIINRVGENEIHINDITDEMLVFSVNSNNKVVFKLNAVNHSPMEFAFVNMKGAYGFNSGISSSIRDAIIKESQYFKVIVLDNLSELKDYI